jgi:hypothetical protein
MIKTEFKNSEITAQIIGASMEVHRVVDIYQRALEKELIIRGIGYQRELEMLIFYKGHMVGKA